MSTMNNTAHMMEAARPAKSRRRTQSRGSTASIHSVTTTPNLDHSFADTSAVYSTQWLSQDRSQPRELAPAPSHMAHMADHLGTEHMILQAASHLQHSRDFSMDTSMGSVGHAVSFHQHAPMGHAPLPTDAMSVNNSFVDGDSQMMEREGEGDGDSVAGVPGTGKAARSSANNELEMRQLFSQNKHRTLVDVAEELHGNERGPHSERTRQVFAMLWINQVCTKGKGSVPRGRVYANYASRCATERITVLNPASFGKLVRVLFPGLKTRRLGVRGESKYHYVNFALTEEQPELKDAPSIPQVPLAESASLTQNFNTIPGRASSVRAERALLPSPDHHNLYQQQQPDSQAPRRREYRHSVYNMPKVSTLDELNASTQKTEMQLSLSPDTGASFKQSDPVVLPRIEPFLPSGTDPDAAKSLAALYRSHCTSLVECVRYCKEKTFFHLYTSFQGTLTMPVQKLFSNPAIAPWIEECDFVLYQRMMRILSGLTLQVVPKPVLDTIRSISERLVGHIRESFQGQPAHVVRAKEAPAALFAALLDRELRVNLTAHAAANMLSNPANRDQMYLDWITMVQTRKVAESIPSRAMDEVVNIMLTEIRDLLDPANVPWEMEALTLHGEVTARSGRQSQPISLEEAGASSVLERWASFLRSLPDRFPYAAHTDIVWCVDRLGSAVMRDLTISQGKSFGSWWVTKCWIDEMVSFLAEQGGFLAMKSTQSTAPVVDSVKTQELKPELSLQGSHFTVGGDEFNNLGSHVAHAHSQPNRAPFPTSNSVSNTGHDDGAPSPSHDDSGIGIRTPDEDFPPMDKFEFPTPDTSQMLSAAADLPSVISSL
ncbi:hypothetical protein GGTG_07952 [Gaeumannomyces tritici R3-111a-1]|uniref:RFX-type winged-helix domain-containing protein n=1 Tax=Gaeumannomyces tritici (strain R3-111a-1) TaxID=644352 RepID=J3P362_GAET3|nr:hypothetical protein GGTG_07952 [Gaeumannomyces tritici R3-111a-1]EJT74104.1 hypothetical protein GGTG_07952 [Gaeumannomyces tritici R3-111a-1]